MSRDMVCANTSSSARIPCRVVYPGASDPLICAARYSLNRVVNSGPLTCLIVTSVDSGTGVAGGVAHVELTDVLGLAF